MRERWRSSHLRPSWGFPRCTRKDSKFHQSSRPQHTENRAEPSMEFWLQREAPCNFRENNGGARDQLLISILNKYYPPRGWKPGETVASWYTQDDWVSRLLRSFGIVGTDRNDLWSRVAAGFTGKEITGILLIKCKLETTIPYRLLMG